MEFAPTDTRSRHRAAIQSRDPSRRDRKKESDRQHFLVIPLLPQHLLQTPQRIDLDLPDTLARHAKITGNFLESRDFIAVQAETSLDNDALFAGITFNGNLSKTHQDLVNQPGGSYAAEDFLSLVRMAVEENWIENGVMSDEK